MKKIIFSFAFALMSVVALAQGHRVSGTVTDANSGEPLIGASVRVEGSNRGTTADPDGKYKIECYYNEYLIFSYNGYETQRIKVMGAKIDAALVPDNEGLEEAQNEPFASAVIPAWHNE